MAIKPTILKTRMEPFGRPTKYKEYYCNEMIDFFDVEHFEWKEEKTTYRDGTIKEKPIAVPNPVPFFSRFALTIDVCHDTLLEWCKKHPNFSLAYKKCKEMQAEMIGTNGMMGLYNATFTIFAAKNMIGWKNEEFLNVQEHKQLTIEVQTEEQKKILENVGKIDKE